MRDGQGRPLHQVTKADGIQGVHDYVQQLLDDLSEMFGRAIKKKLGVEQLKIERDLDDYRAVSWSNEPYALGGTSYIKYTGASREQVLNVRRALASAAETKPLFWAGEATAIDAQPWSVHGAYDSGWHAARQVLSHLGS